jgi:hypothetical protein
VGLVLEDDALVARFDEGERRGGRGARACVEDHSPFGGLDAEELPRHDAVAFHVPMKAEERPAARARPHLLHRDAVLLSRPGSLHPGQAGDRRRGARRLGLGR